MDVELQATPIIIAPLQTRVVPFFLRQSAAFTGDALGLVIRLKSGSLSETVSVSLPVVHHQLASSERNALKGTFLSAGTSLSAFLAIPPALSSPQQQPPVLALRQLISKTSLSSSNTSVFQMVLASTSSANLSGGSHCQNLNLVGLSFRQAGLRGYELSRT